MMLEDDFTYVLRKALMGHGMAPAEAALKAGMGEAEVLAVLRGKFSAATVRGLAAVLGLNAEALAEHEFYQPRPLRLAGIDRMDLPLRRERVNAWLVRHGGARVLFDAGFEAWDLLRELGARGGQWPEHVCITHGHPDHVAAVPQLLAAGVPVSGAGIEGACELDAGDVLKCGEMEIVTCDLSGHAMPALGYLIAGFEVPVLVTGDAIFAGSIGGCGSPAVYQHALQRLREVLRPLPDETVLLPGHGPATTLGEERVSNPFL